MIEKGVVTFVENEFTYIKKKKEGGCDHCHSSKACAVSMADSEVVIKTINKVGAVVGDHVLFEVKTPSVLKLYIHVYLIPVLMLISGAAVGLLFSSYYHMTEYKDFFSVLFGFLFFSVSIAALSILNKRVENEKKYWPLIIKIVDGNEDNKDND